VIPLFAQKKQAKQLHDYDAGGGRAGQRLPLGGEQRNSTAIVDRSQAVEATPGASGAGAHLEAMASKVA
jgi:hypothetical protein